MTVTTPPWACVEVRSRLGWQHPPSPPEKCASSLHLPSTSPAASFGGSRQLMGKKESTGQGAEGGGQAASRSVGRCCGSGREAEAGSEGQESGPSFPPHPGPLDGQQKGGAGHCRPLPSPPQNNLGIAYNIMRHEHLLDQPLREGGGRQNAEKRRTPAPAEPAPRVAASGGVWNIPRENKTIIFDNLHQYHLHPPPPRPRMALPSPARRPSLLCALSSATAGKLNKPIVSSIDLIWGPENSADSTVLNY